MVVVAGVKVMVSEVSEGVVVVVVVVVVAAPAQVDGQVPSEPAMCVPASVVFVEHQAWEPMSAVTVQVE